jgi:hypothetical protein
MSHDHDIRVIVLGRRDMVNFVWMLGDVTHTCPSIRPSRLLSDRPVSPIIPIQAWFHHCVTRGTCSLPRFTRQAYLRWMQSRQTGRTRNKAAGDVWGGDHFGRRGPVAYSVRRMQYILISL